MLCTAHCMHYGNCFCWSYYDEDQEKLFNEAHVISPFRNVTEGMRRAPAQVVHQIFLFILTAIFQLNLACPVLLELRTMEAVVTAGAIKRAKLQTNQHPTFYGPDALPVAKPTVSEHWRENRLYL